MGDKTAIEWTDATWNPVRGCAIVSKGCTNCYAMRQAHRSNHSGGAYAGLTKLTKGGPVWTGDVRLVPELLDQPLRWRRPRRIFVNSMSDLFHEDVPDDFIWRVLAVAALCPQHTFQILTKRADRLPKVIPADEHEGLSRLCHALGGMLDGTWIWSDGRAFRYRIEKAISATIGIDFDDRGEERQVEKMPWPLPNVWLGVSVEDAAAAGERIPPLLKTPSAIRWVSAEPLLAPVYLVPYLTAFPLERILPGEPIPGRSPHINWVVVGGESGPGARPMQPSWARSLRDQCADAGVPFFFKQWGAWTPCLDSGGHVEGLRERLVDNTWMLHVGKKAAGRELDGRTHDEYPA